MTLQEEIIRQTNLASRITDFLADTKKHGPEKLTAGTLRTRLALLESYWSKFGKQHDELIVNSKYLQTEYAQKDTYHQVEFAYIEAQAALTEQLEEMSIAKTQPTVSSNPQRASGKLPVCRLPTFSGDYLEWESFRDLFTSLVHNVPDLSDAERLQYLKSSLTGDAAKIIGNVKVTDANYQGAWKALEERYDNKRLLLYHHFRSLMSLQPLTTDSVTALRTLLDTTKEVRRSLENMGRPVAQWDDWFVFLTVQKLHTPLQRDWENTLGEGKHIPSFRELEQFLANRLQSMEITTSPSQRQKVRVHHAKTQPTTTPRNCQLCKHNHHLCYCPEFRKRTIKQRKQLVAQWSICQNCLRSHSTDVCTSTHRCFTCGGEHHTLLHEETTFAPPTPPKELSSAHARSEPSRTRHTTLLATAIVKVKGSNGQTALVRALLDQGSEATFLSEDLAQRLRLNRAKVSVPVTGIGATKCCTATAIVQVQLTSPDDKEDFSLSVNAYVLPRLTKTFRTPESVGHSWSHLRYIKLSDADSNWPSKIDLVIGADIYGHVLLDGLIKGPPNAPVAQRTIFGWVLSGRLDNQSSHDQPSPVTAFHCSIDTSLSEELTKFWEIEEPERRHFLSAEEEACETHFRNTYSRSPDGRFVVRLPKRSDVPLGNSRPIALRTFQRNERQRQHDGALNQAYIKFMQEYLDLGHMALAPTIPFQDCCYLPHHAVWKGEGQSQKIRVVFNASSKTPSGNSLNDLLLPGPKLQQDISDVILRWRKHAIAFTTDIVKMFRQIWVHPDDQNLQRILWRNDPSQELQEFQLKTVTYGTASAPFLAIRCLQQLAADEETRYPTAAQILRTQSYVDDILAGADVLEDAVRLKEELQRLLMAGGFQLAKWASNCPGLADNDSESHFLSDGSVKTLGLQWHPKTDAFGFKVTLENFSQITKRSVLSCTAKLFDPLGWLAPVLVKAKMFLQDLWTTRTDWDDALPTSLETAWIQYYQSLIKLQDLQIPRWISLMSTSSWEIHGFCDASVRAYAAAVYVRVLLPDGLFSSHLLMAKTKVAPLKVISLPRLELCGAALLAKLLQRIEGLFSGASRVFAWTDSQVVLCWLRAHPSRWKCFVANRTSEIHQKIPNAIWNHVASGDNPADPASRGVNAELLSGLDLWWHGPPWLSKPSSEWPQSISTQDSAEAQSEENQRVTALTTRCGEAFTLQDRFSSLLRLLRVTAWITRFGQNSRTNAEKRTSGPLTVREIASAQKVWIRICQSEAYNNEIQSLNHNKPLPRESSLLSLRPFLDPEGLLRVGGRLEHSTLGYDERHPYIVPPKCNFAKLLITDAHHRVLHGGPQLTISQLTRRFWIIHGRRHVRDIIRKCIKCTRYNGKITPPLMGQLPSNRVTPSRPFHHTGLDYAGPLQLRTSRGRGHKSYKGYIALFVCMATKAIHLEAVSDCTTAGFVAAFKRFCARRGIPATIYSDQATNFRGADASLRSLLQTASQENQELAGLLANDGTEWKFIPPHSPHFGGIWEAGVRSVKFHLRRAMGEHTLTFEELSTLLAEIEACLNSRPIAPLSSSAQDFSPLTPGHFLIGTSTRTVPEPSLLEIPENRLSRWQLLRRLYEQFWRRWSTEYVRQLQQRSKWRAVNPQLQINDMVLVKEDHLPPAKWSLGRVIQTHPGADGVIRVVTLRTATAEIQRPVIKLCRLPIDP